MAQEQGDVTPQRPREIESQIAQTRAEMDQTLDELSERFRPSTLIDEAACWFREKVWNPVAPLAQDYTQSAFRSMRDHPLAAATLGATALFILYQAQQTAASSRSDRGEPRLGEQGGYEDLLQETSPMDEPTEPAGQEMQQGSERAREWARRTREGASALRERMSERLSESTRQLRHRTRHLRRRVQESGERAGQSFEHYPLLFGAAALGCGVLLGMAMPTSRPERRLIGPAAERARRRAREMSHDVVERTRHAAAEAAHAAREAAQREGLTPDQLRERAARVADEAQQAAQREIHPGDQPNV